MASKNPFDMTELMKMFSADKIAAMFDPAQMSAALDPKQFQNFDMQAVLKTHKANYEAMVAANVAAAGAYKAFCEKQMAVYQDVMGGASKQVEALQAKSIPDLQQKQKVIYEDAVQKSLSIMTDLAEATKKANEDAFKIIQGRVDETIKEISKKA